MVAVKKIWDRFTGFVSRGDSVMALVTRLGVGYLFVESGWGKLAHLDRATEFFVSLGIPFAAAQAPFVAVVEFVGGLLLMVGFGTRAVAIPLACTMVVALATAKAEDVTGITALFAQSEALYIVLFGWLVVNGSGKFSVDALLMNKWHALGRGTGNTTQLRRAS